MALILDNNVKETEILKAYGLTVYGKINRYVWTIARNEEENALINIIIVNDTSKEIVFSMNMGNRCILQSRINDTLDNFLYWIATENPDTYAIEKQVYNSLCKSDSLFNHSIMNKKQKAKRKEEEEKRIAEHKETEKKKAAEIEEYCNRSGLIPCFTYEGIYLVKALTEKAENIIKTADNKYMEMLLKFIDEYPDNTDARIIVEGNIEEILQYIKYREKRKRSFTL